MVDHGTRADKPARGRFQEPAWTKASREWQEIDRRLAADHRARQIDRMVDELKLDVVFRAYAGLGKPAHRPDLMLKILLYELARGRNSPAQWYRDTQEDDGVQWLGRGLRPSRTACYEFRDRMIPVWEELNRQALDLARSGGWLTAQRAALDGTLPAALSTRHTYVNQEALEERLKTLHAAIAADQGGQPSCAAPRWMGATPQGRLEQRERYHRARRRMQELHAENNHRRACRRTPAERIVLSLGDPEAAVGLDKLRVYRPLYNVQILQDLDSPFVLGWGVFARQYDSGTLPPVLEQAARLGSQPQILLADSGYATNLDLAACLRLGVTLYAPVEENDFTDQSRRAPRFLPKSAFVWRPDEQCYVCPEGHHLKRSSCSRIQRSGEQTVLQTLYLCPPEHCRLCPRREQCTPNPDRGRSVCRLEYEELLDELRQRMETPEARLLYRLRRQTVELRFADLKRYRGLTEFACRGLRRVRAQVGACVLAHNLLTLAKLRATDCDHEANAARASPQRQTQRTPTLCLA